MSGSMYFVPFRSAPAAKVLEPITHKPENTNAPTGKNFRSMSFCKNKKNPENLGSTSNESHHKNQRLKIKCWA